MSNKKPEPNKTGGASHVGISDVFSGVELIARERARQLCVEGWTPEHDDGHTHAELSAAGACYANCAKYQVQGYGQDISSKGFPGEWMVNGWWKPSDDPIRNLVKAGALIAAEIDRLKRAEAKPENVEVSDDGSR
jgi:hypothetical protein